LFVDSFLKLMFEPKCFNFIGFFEIERMNIAFK